MNGTDIIGRGWKFPIKVNAKGGLDWSAGADRVRDAIWIIVSTSLGERVMRPRFGAGLKDFVFQPNSDVLRAELATTVRKALTAWEPRIELIAVRVDASPNEESLVLISVDYQIRDTNELYNMVYPFYLQEGTL
jgi:phage baseplate assembly protein W